VTVDAVVDGPGDRIAWTAALEQGPDEGGGPGLVDIDNDDGFGVAVDGLGTDAEGACPAMLVAWVEHGPAVEGPHATADVIGLVAKDDDDFVAAGFLELVDLVADERFAGPIEEGLVGAHAAGGAGGEHNGGNHQS